MTSSRTASSPASLVAGDAENLTWTNNNAGGYGSAEWDQRSDSAGEG